MSIDPDLMDIAVSIEKDIPSRITGENRVFIRAVIARELTKARSQAHEGQRQITNEMIFAVMQRAEDFGVTLQDWQASSLLSAAYDIRQHSQKAEQE